MVLKLHYPGGTEGENIMSFTYFDRLGNKINSGSTVEEALVQGCLNYQVIKEATFSVPFTEDPVSHAVTYEMDKALLLPKHRTTVQTLNGERKPIEVVSKSYGLIQNLEAFQFIDDLLGEKGGNIIKAGEFGGQDSNYAKGSCFLVVQTEDVQILGETYNPYLLFTNSFDKSSSIKVCFTPIRVMCQNTIAYAMKKAIVSMSIRHTLTASERLAEANRVLLQQDTSLEMLKKDSEELAKITLTKDQFKDKIVPVVMNALNISPDSSEKKRNKDRYEQTANALIKAYDATDLANLNNTAYKAIQAVADFEVHREPMKNADNGEIYLGYVLDLMKLTTAARQYIDAQVA